MYIGWSCPLGVGVGAGVVYATLVWIGASLCQGAQSTVTWSSYVEQYHSIVIVHSGQFEVFSRALSLSSHHQEEKKLCT